jgi:coenzyme PQQ precursor peptide PqqA
VISAPARELRCYAVRAASSSERAFFNQRQGDLFMQWTTPAFEDLRFGFEITMYVSAR